MCGVIREWESFGRRLAVWWRNNVVSDHNSFSAARWSCLNWPREMSKSLLVKKGKILFWSRFPRGYTSTSRYTAAVQQPSVHGIAKCHFPGSHMSSVRVETHHHHLFHLLGLSSCLHAQTIQTEYKLPSKGFYFTNWVTQPLCLQFELNGMANWLLSLTQPLLCLHFDLSG